MLHPRHQVSLRGSIAGQLVGDHDAGRTHLLSEQLTQQAFRGDLVTLALDQNVQHDPVLIHCPPEPVLYPGNLHRDFVKVPLITSLRQPTADLIGEGLTELQPPLPYAFVADDDAASSEDLIDMAQTERKAEIQPDGEADDLSWEAVTGVARWGQAWSSGPATQPG